MNTQHSDDNKGSCLRNKTDILHDFQVSFFAMSRLPTLPWTFLDRELQNDRSSELISDILKQTCLHPLCRKHPPSVKYRRLFLTELIKRHESTDSEPLDELYDALGEVLGAEEGTECYKNYLLPCGDAVSLSESVAVISEGTTGLVTWEAALYLTEWALDNQQAFTGRTVLELGSGMGLTGIAICRSCRPASYVFSDCHLSVLQRLRDNVQLNSLDNQSAPRVTENSLANQSTPRVTENSLANQSAPRVTENSLANQSAPRVTENSLANQSTPRVTENSLDNQSAPRVTENSLDNQSAPRVTENSLANQSTPRVTENSLANQSAPRVTENSLANQSTPRVTENSLANQSAPRVTENSLVNQSTPNQSAPRVSVEELDWEAVTEERIREIGANTVIAADVVYDPDIIGCLVKLLSRILRCASPGGPPDILICSTVRNPDTYTCFKHQLENARISHDVVTGPVNHVFPYNRVSTIELIRLYI